MRIRQLRPAGRPGPDRRRRADGPRRPQAGAAREIAALIAMAVIFITVTGHGLVLEGNNSDDWRHVTGAYLWGVVEGRWFMEIIFRDVFNGPFHTLAQLVLAFGCFSFIAWMNDPRLPAGLPGRGRSLRRRVPAGARIAGTRAVAIPFLQP